jgi:uncharacterized protein YdeI (YjbR/CyaY-like superfamily)
MKTLTVRAVGEWRAWLAAHGATEREVRLVVRRTRSSKPGVRYAEAVEQALCFGWIDSHARKHDADSFLLRFTPRRPRSAWSPTNIERAARMIERGEMTDAGRASLAHKR